MVAVDLQENCNKILLNACKLSMPSGSWEFWFQTLHNVKIPFSLTYQLTLFAPLKKKKQKQKTNCGYNLLFKSFFSLFYLYWKKSPCYNKCFHKKCLCSPIVPKCCVSHCFPKNGFRLSLLLNGGVCISEL